MCARLALLICVPVLMGQIPGQTDVLGQIAALCRERTGDLERIEAARKSGGSTWSRTVELRRSLAEDAGRTVGPWITADQPPPPEEVARVLLALCAFLDPAALREEWQREHGTVLEGLPALEDAGLRRDLLFRVSDRVLATPGTTDLDALVETVAWAVWFLPAEPVEALARLSGDLVILFTELGGNARTESGHRNYRPERFTSTGFAPRLRDDSDQVRHFCWALRMFCVAQPGLAERVLLQKEEIDSLRRQLPMNQADLALNAVARELAGEILRTGERPALEWRDLPQRLRALLSAPE